MNRQKMAFDRTNFILLAIGMAVIIIGFVLMSGPGSTEGYFEPDIFSARRIKVAPVVCFLGFVFMIYGILRKPHDAAQPAESATPKEGEA
jgi:uncharacterized membrane protein